ncbi:MAG: ParM/StbA family protein [Lachnospiraceae bacterium]|nr:ParM/StbA family protein [Lachnospiraceae bacterium]
MKKETSELMAEVIGIDHGNSQIKTISAVFPAGVMPLSTQLAFHDNVLEFRGKLYKIGSKKMEVQKSKTESLEFYLLTLAATAMEMKTREKREAKVILAVGLPPARYGVEKNAFREYLMQNDEVSFTYEEEEFRVKFVKVLVYPQGYPAVIDRLAMFGSRLLIADVGSWTVDFVPIVNRRPDEAKVISLPHGMITLYRAINAECFRRFGEGLDEEEITKYVTSGKTLLPEEFQQVMDAEIKKFIRMIIGTIREEGYNLMTTSITFVGGGATLMKNFGNNSLFHFSFVTDVKANAIGYEVLAKMALKGGDGHEPK